MPVLPLCERAAPLTLLGSSWRTSALRAEDRAAPGSVRPAGAASRIRFRHAAGATRGRVRCHPLSTSQLLCHTRGSQPDAAYHVSPLCACRARHPAVLCPASRTCTGRRLSCTLMAQEPFSSQGHPLEWTPSCIRYYPCALPSGSNFCQARSCETWAVAKSSTELEHIA